MTDEELQQIYAARYVKTLVPIAQRLQDNLIENLAHLQRIDRIAARAKSVDRFMGKATKIGDDGNRKYGDPLNQIQDQIGARVVVFYLDDVHQISTEIERYYSPIERKELIPDSESEFGYIGKHYILALPDEVFDDEQLLSLPNFFELQIKTLFQHAWSEASHDLAYKAKDELTSHQKRQFAFTAAQAWGADNIFSTLYSELG